VQLRPGALDAGASSFRVTGAAEDAQPRVSAGQVRAQTTSRMMTLTCYQCTGSALHKY
jgi:hypothetical protein